MLFDHLILFVSMVSFKFDNLSFKLLNASLHLHLNELFVTASILPHFIEHTLIFVLKSFHFVLMLLCQVALHFFKLLLGADFELG